MVKTLEKHKIEIDRNYKNNMDDNIHRSEAQKIMDGNTDKEI